MALSQDFRDLLAAFGARQVRYLLIGGYAVAFHAKPRFTKDLDLWVEPTEENLARAVAALSDFGAPPQALEDLVSSRDDEIIWFGVPPARVDLLKRVPGVAFGVAYARRVEATWEDVGVAVIGRDDLIRAKEAAGRPQDLLDAANLAAPADTPADGSDVTSTSTGKMLVDAARGGAESPAKDGCGGQR